MSVLTQPCFHDEQAAYDYLESIVWPDGPTCPHCGATDRIYALKGKSTRIGTRKCGHCRKPFTVKVGTVFESSHVPLHKWLQAVYLMVASKKGISAHQLHRTLEVTYRTAWFMEHRIREAMRSGELAPMGRLGETAEHALAIRKRLPIKPPPWISGVSKGSLFGELRGVLDVSGERTFYICPPSGPDQVECVFPESLRGAMGEHLFQVVRVHGWLHYDGRSAFPKRIEAERVDGVEAPAEPFSALYGLFAGAGRGDTFEVG